MSRRRGARKHPGGLSGGLPSKGGESVERIIKLAVAVAQLLLAIAELIRLFKAH
jgi:hypothetical protein